eukprot:g4134.t1
MVSNFLVDAVGGMRVGEKRKILVKQHDGELGGKGGVIKKKQKALVKLTLEDLTDVAGGTTVTDVEEDEEGLEWGLDEEL